MKIKVINIISFIDRSLVWEWLIDYFSDSTTIEFCFIVLNPGESELVSYLKKKKIKVWELRYRGKRDFIVAFFKIFKILISERPLIINTNLIDASIIGHLAGWLAGIKFRVNTRHHSSFHHDYFPHGIKYDKLVNNLSTHIVTASGIVKRFLVRNEGVPENKIEVINFGFDIDQFDNYNEERVHALRNKYLTTNKEAYPVVGVISRFIKWKGIQYVIPAFKQVLLSYPNAHLILANASGSYKEEILNLLKDIPEKHYSLIPFEKDSVSLYKLFDIFVHVPVDEISEAFGQIYIEALAAGVPTVVTISGIAHDFMQDRVNTLVVDYKSSDEITRAIMQILSDKQLRSKLITNGKLSVSSRYTSGIMLQKWESYYLSLKSHNRL